MYKKDDIGLIPIAKNTKNFEMNKFRSKSNAINKIRSAKFLGSDPRTLKSRFL
jgi:hypothetical protein